MKSVERESAAPPKPRPWISKGALNLLRRIDQSEDHELVREKGAGWWVGNHHVSARYANELTVLCAVGLSQGCTLGEFERWYINEDGRGLLADENYEPRIISARVEVGNAG